MLLGLPLRPNTIIAFIKKEHNHFFVQKNQTTTKGVYVWGRRSTKVEDGHRVLENIT